MAQAYLESVNYCPKRALEEESKHKAEVKRYKSADYFVEHAITSALPISKWIDSFNKDGYACVELFSSSVVDVTNSQLKGEIDEIKRRFQNDLGEDDVYYKFFTDSIDNFGIPHLSCYWDARIQGHDLLRKLTDKDNFICSFEAPIYGSLTKKPTKKIVFNQKRKGSENIYRCFINFSETLCGDDRERINIINPLNEHVIATIVPPRGSIVIIDSSKFKAKLFSPWYRNEKSTYNGTLHILPITYQHLDKPMNLTSLKKRQNQAKNRRATNDDLMSSKIKPINTVQASNYHARFVSPMSIVSNISGVSLLAKAVDRRGHIYWYCTDPEITLLIEGSLSACSR